MALRRESSAGTVYLDTAALIARTNRRDQLHAITAVAYQRLRTQGCRFLSTSSVLEEYLTAMRSAQNREMAAKTVQQMLLSKEISILFVDHELWNRSLTFYQQHHDKEWSFADCVSFTVMRESGIRRALTNDHHFEQAGFEILLK